MHSSGENIRFQMLVNGAVVGTAGMESIGVLSAMVDWVRRDPAKVPPNAPKDAQFTAEDWVGNDIQVRLGGLDSKAQEHVQWFSCELQVGDEVTIRVLPAGEIDAPEKRHAASEGG